MAEFEEVGGYPAFTLEYELVPGVAEAEAEGGFSRFLVDVLTFSLTGIGLNGVRHDGPAGDLVVDLARGDAIWRPVGSEL